MGVSAKDQRRTIFDSAQSIAVDAVVAIDEQNCTNEVGDERTAQSCHHFNSSAKDPAGLDRRQPNLRVRYAGNSRPLAESDVSAVHDHNERAPARSFLQTAISDSGHAAADGNPKTVGPIAIKRPTRMKPQNH